METLFRLALRLGVCPACLLYYSMLGLVVFGMVIAAGGSWYCERLEEGLEPLLVCVLVFNLLRSRFLEFRLCAHARNR